jgi:serine/threonine protein phosphatase PrpC
LAAYARSKEASDVQGAPGALNAAFLDSQEAILREQQLRNARGEMKTTLTLLTIVGSQAQWGHIGDTRLYWFTDSRLKQRTLDHSVPQMLVATGEIREKDIRGHEDRNRLLRVMGIEWLSPRYELSEQVTLNGSDSFLLCTDGFWGYVSEKAMLRALKSARTPESWLAQMLAVAERNALGHNRDNFSAIAVFVR